MMTAAERPKQCAETIWNGWNNYGCDHPAKFVIRRSGYLPTPVCGVHVRSYKQHYPDTVYNLDGTKVDVPAPKPKAVRPVDHLRLTDAEMDAIGRAVNELCLLAETDPDRYGDVADAAQAADDKIKAANHPYPDATRSGR